MLNASALAMVSVDWAAITVIIPITTVMIKKGTFSKTSLRSNFLCARKSSRRSTPVSVTADDLAVVDKKNRMSVKKYKRMLLAPCLRYFT